MGLLDSLHNVLGGASDLAAGAIGDITQGATDSPIVQDLQDQATILTDGANQAITSVTEQGQAALEDITQNRER